MIDNAELTRRFAYHPPSHPGIGEAHEDVRRALGIAATCVIELTPECREQSLAITALEEAMMWANAAIARNQAVGS